MIVVKMEGGLGNQMFIYSLAKSVQSRGYSVLIDTSWYGNVRNKNSYQYNPTTTIRNLDITNYRLSINMSHDFDCISFFKKHDKLYSIKERLKPITPKPLRKKYKYIVTDKARIADILHNGLRDNMYFEGYFQSLHVVSGIEDLLEREFTLQSDLPQDIKSMQSNMSHKESVMLHIRRGDYLSPVNGKFINLGNSYYDSALRIIRDSISNAHIFVFSNDIAWCKTHFLAELSSDIVDHMPFSFVDINGEDGACFELALMRSCKHAIIANSTFSWWGAFLSYHRNTDNRVVIAPDRFTYSQDLQDLYPHAWQQVAIALI